MHRGSPVLHFVGQRRQADDAVAWARGGHVGHREFQAVVGRRAGRQGLGRLRRWGRRQCDAWRQERLLPRHQIRTAGHAQRWVRRCVQRHLGGDLNYGLERFRLDAGALGPYARGLEAVGARRVARRGPRCSPPGQTQPGGHRDEEQALEFHAWSPESSHLAPRDEWGRHSCLPGRQECLPHKLVRLAERVVHPGREDGVSVVHGTRV